MEAHWRIKPGPALEHAVRQISLREGRTLANTLKKLLSEAVDQRRLVALQSPDVRTAIVMLEGAAIATSKQNILASTDVEPS
jgi:hypothetical protein